MPQTNDRLRQKFGYDQGEAESIILCNGGKVIRGVIDFPLDQDNDEVWDAIQYLIEEWDYTHISTEVGQKIMMDYYTELYGELLYGTFWILKKDDA